MRAKAGMAGSENGRRDARLRSWKEIAAFFGTDERTARRWEGRGLPVRRVPGGARATIYADVADLEQWLKDGRAAEPAVEAVPVPMGRPVWRWLAAAAGIAAGAVAVGAALTGAPEPQPAARARPSGEAAELSLAASYELERRTPQSLERARDLFGRAVAQDPGYAEAYAGLASTYLLMREFSAIPEAEAYPRAREAAERAVALDPKLANAHAALGFVTFYWTRDWPRGLASLDRAISLEPGSARARHWYATALLHTGRARDALAAIEEAQKREPGSRTILADKGIILFHAGRTPDAVALLRQMATDEPDFSSPHSYLAAIALARKDYAGYLAETAAAARIKGNGEQLRLAEEGERALRGGGPRAMLVTMLEGEAARRRAGGGSDFALARLRAALGDRDGALRLLESSYRRGEPDIVALRVEPMLMPLRGDPAFERLAERVARPLAEG